MKKIISFILCIAMLLSPVQVVFADENEEEFYNTVSVEFSDNIGNLETLEVMVKDDNVYANVEELAARLGYDVSISDEYVSVYNKEASENIPYGLTVFYYDSTKVSHMLFTKMVDTYEAPCETLKNENGVWIPLEYSLLLLNSSMLIVENTILIDMPSKNVIDIYMDILKNNQTYLFDWNKDFGYTEFDWKLVGSASHVVNMFNGLLKKDGATWVQFVQMFAMDSSSYDSKYSEAIAELFCTYSDSELKKEVSHLKEIMGHFNGSGTLGKTLKALEKSVPTDEDIGELQKVCKDLKNKIDEGNGSVNAYNRAYQALENACDEATLFQNTAGVVLDVQKNVKNATGIVKKLFLVAEVIGYAKEFQNQDEFAVDSLTKFIQNKDSESVMSNAMKSGIEVYTYMLQTNILTYSALQYLMKNYDSLLMDAADLSSSFGTEATLVLIAWDLVQSANILNIGDKIKAADKFELATYSTIFQSDAFVDYQGIRDGVFSTEENITPENLYKVAQSCYAYLKFCYITRDAAIASLKAKTENTQEAIQPLVDYQKSINEEIAGYLVQLKNVDTTNESKCYGFLPEDNVDYLKKYNSTAILEIVKKLNPTENDIEIYKDILDMYYYKIDIGWDETEDVSYLFYWGYSAINTLSDAGYILTDLDGNGISELIVTAMDAAKEGMIYDLYTYVDGKIVHVATSGERYRYYLCDDNTIYFEGSGGALLSSWEKYIIDANKESLSLFDMVVYDGYTNEENPWYYGNTDCYDEEYGYNIEYMTNITEKEAQSIIDVYQNQVRSIQLNSFETYSPYGKMSTDNMLKKSFNSFIDSEIPIYFICDDFNADGNLEGFGITGDDNGWDLENVKVYMINNNGLVDCIDEFEYLYGYGGGYFNRSDVADYSIIDTGSHKFLSLGGIEGQETWIYGVKEGKAYKPKVSGEHAEFFKIEDGLYCAEPHEGGDGYYEIYYEYDSNSGEFIPIK